MFLFIVGSFENFENFTLFKSDDFLFLPDFNELFFIIVLVEFENFKLYSLLLLLFYINNLIYYFFNIIKNKFIIIIFKFYFNKKFNIKLFNFNFMVSKVFF